MILLSFDTEEFDVPKEHGVDFTLDEGMEVSIAGTTRILDVLDRTGVKATFFCTGNFVRKAPHIMQRIIEGGHEVAGHGVDHWSPKSSDVSQVKQIIKEDLGIEIRGYRQPRMFPVSYEDIATNGYIYNSSLNPAFIPGRYMHLTTPRKPFLKDGVLQIPASVTPIVRFPLFWLALHNLPERLYHLLVKWVLKGSDCFVTYFHPWEFFDLKQNPQFRMPFIIRNNSGMAMCRRLENLIEMLKARGESFCTYTEYSIKKIEELKKEQP